MKGQTSSINRLVIYGLAWHRRPSGLWAPSERPSQQRVHLALDGDVSGRGPVAVLNRLPSSFEQFGVFVDEEALGLEVSTLHDLEIWIGSLGFESAAVGAAKLAFWIDDLPTDAAAQVEFARNVFGSPAIVEAIARFLAPLERAVVLAEQHVVAFSRLAVRCARAGVLGDMSTMEARVLERSLLGMSALSESRGLTDANPPSDWLPFLVQNGAFNAAPPLLESLGRIAAILLRAGSHEARARADFCDLGAWAVKSSQVSLRHQLSWGIAAIGKSGAFDTGPPGPGTAVLQPDFFSAIAEQLGGSTAARGLLSADRQWYSDEFDRIERELALDPHTAAAGYNRTPFEARPFLRLANGQYLLWSPRAIVSWLTDGFYYRALDFAREIGRRDEFLTFWGYLVERYAVEVLAEAHPEPRPPGSGRVFREQEYGPRKRRVRSPDAMIDFGPDLVAVEVFSGRLSLAARVSGSPTKIAQDITKMVAAKGVQLSRRIDDFIAGRFELPDVHPHDVRRIWPIVVTGPGLMMSELLWDEIERRMDGALHQARVQPLTVLDLTDVEQLAGLVEAGWSVPQLLERKTGAYRKLEWRRMVSEDPALPETRASQVLARWRDAWRAMVIDFGWDPDEVDRRMERDAA